MITITYEGRNTLYINMTNRCPCNCVFCLRNNKDHVFNSSSLWLDREPTVDEVCESIDSRDLEKYDEIVFCGYGEPTERLITILEAYQKREFEEKWSYELANLYYRVGKNEECVKLCDEIVLWFGVGTYVDKAMELKQRIAPLTPDQIEKRENKEKYPCVFNEEPPYEVISTPWLSSDEIKMLKNCEDALDRLYNSGRFLFTLEYLVDEVGVSPFELFYSFGNAVNGRKMRLSEYAEELYNFFRVKCDKEKLREKIICDLLCCCSSTQIPDVLKVKDPLYKRIKKYFSDNEDNNIKFVILYSEKRIFAVDYGKEKNLNNRYEGEFYDFCQFHDDESMQDKDDKI
mgnify:CR=1 FL=1